MGRKKVSRKRYKIPNSNEIREIGNQIVLCFLAFCCDHQRQRDRHQQRWCRSHHHLHDHHHFCLSEFQFRRKVISINRVKWSGVSVTGCSRSLFIILFGSNWLKLNARKWRYIRSLDRTATASICSNRLVEETKNAAGRWLVFFFH